MDKQTFLDDLMLDALEDSIRLWDVRSLASGAFPGLSPAGQENLAKDAVRTLLDRGWVSVFQREWAGTRPGPEVPVERVEALALVDRADAWGEHTDRPEYVILSTDRGEREFTEDARRRGLLRE